MCSYGLVWLLVFLSWKLGRDEESYKRQANNSIRQDFLLGNITKDRTIFMETMNDDGRAVGEVEVYFTD